MLQVIFKFSHSTSSLSLHDVLLRRYMMEKHNEEKSYDDDGEESEDNEKCNCFSSLCAFRPLRFQGQGGVSQEHSNRSARFNAAEVSGKECRVMRL
jgi:hypothetical protein